MSEALWFLWAKKSRETGEKHPLIYHLIDVAMVTATMWDESLTKGMRQHFAQSLELSPDATRQTLAFWAGLHDLGKASPAFQGKCDLAREGLADRGLSFPRFVVRGGSRHGMVSAYALPSLLESETGLPRRLSRQVARAVGGHHGVWPSPLKLSNLDLAQAGGEEWQALRRELLLVLRDLLSPPLVGKIGHNQEEENAFLTLLSGLTSVTDWLGSMERYFPFVSKTMEPAKYAKHAASQAQRALNELGWTGWRPPAQPKSFQELFEFSPRPMQERVIQLAAQLPEPALVLIEAPTGVGKTEAALYLADHWALACQQRGLYVAMPTMAISNQMFGRVKEILNRRYPKSLINMHLIHSEARWSESFQHLRLETADDRPEGAVAALTWFVPRKRSLLASFGVGTVDQALMSVLQTRHFFVRLFGLGHKTIVFDEVHAYDTYMSEIFCRLIAWLRAVGASVVILSATLPRRTRERLLRAYCDEPIPEIPRVPYPSISYATGNQIKAVQLRLPESRTIDLDWIDRDPGAIAAWLGSELRDGGCAAVICNTVRRAQEVYQAIKATRAVTQEQLILFHSRFPSAWRSEIEDAVLRRFGTGNQRPTRGIVVATQVIEQSLDLDFDLMVTDLAPADLILQRAGRLHRHEREGRPPELYRPRLCIAKPADLGGAPDFESDVWVYEPYILLRSYVALRGRDRLVLPNDTEALIEDVYGDSVPDDFPVGLTARLEEARLKMKTHEGEDAFKARLKLVAAPEAEGLLTKGNLGLDEDNPEVHQALRAMTRLIPPSVSLVCFHDTPRGLALEPDGTQLVELEQEPTGELTDRIAQHTVRVTSQPVVGFLLEQGVPRCWKRNPVLRNYRVAVFVDGVCEFDGQNYRLRLSRELGLEIIKEG